MKMTFNIKKVSASFCLMVLRTRLESNASFEDCFGTPYESVSNQTNFDLKQSEV